MKKLFLIALIALFAFAGTAQLAYADEGDVYVGVKTGIMMVDELEDDPFDDITVVGLLLGVGLTPEVSIEGELNMSVSSGDMDEINIPGMLTAEGDVDIWTLGAYAVYRHPINDTISLKGKAGALLVSMDFSYSGTLFGTPFAFSDDETDVEASVGAGATIKLTDQIDAEVEYTFMSSDIGYLSAGLNYKF